MQHVILLEIFEIGVAGSRMVQVVVDRVVEDVPEELTRDQDVQIVGWDEVGEGGDDKEVVDCVAGEGWEDETETIHGEGVVDTVEHEVEGEDAWDVWQPVIF